MTSLFPISKRPPYVLNTRIYSCILLDNTLDIRCGMYNEDTDISIRFEWDFVLCCSIVF